MEPQGKRILLRVGGGQGFLLWDPRRVVDEVPASTCFFHSGLYKSERPAPNATSERVSRRTQEDTDSNRGFGLTHTWPFES